MSEKRPGDFVVDGSLFESASKGYDIDDVSKIEVGALFPITMYNINVSYKDRVFPIAIDICMNHLVGHRPMLFDENKPHLSKYSYQLVIRKVKEALRAGGIICRED